MQNNSYLRFWYEKGAFSTKLDGFGYRILSVVAKLSLIL
jgi:hypothetical protein